MNDTPMPLDVAIARCFADGGVTKAHLLAAIRRGDLACEKIGRAYFVTAGDIREWRNKCRARGSRQGFVSGNGKAVNHDGSLSMDERKSTLAAALAITKGLRKSSGNTSRPRVKSTPAPATPLRLVSQT
jgi:hypothetical protein